MKKYEIDEDTLVDLLSLKIMFDDFDRRNWWDYLQVEELDFNSFLIGAKLKLKNFKQI